MLLQMSIYLCDLPSPALAQIADSFNCDLAFEVCQLANVILQSSAKFCIPTLPERRSVGRLFIWFSLVGCVDRSCNQENRQADLRSRSYAKQASCTGIFSSVDCIASERRSNVMYGTSHHLSSYDSSSTIINRSLVARMIRFGSYM